MTTSEEKHPNYSVSEEADSRLLHVCSVVNSLGLGMINPFMGVYAVELGASSEMGWFQSLETFRIT